MGFFTDILGYFGKQSKSFLITLSILTVIVIGVVDYITGYEIGLSLFYLMPIAFAAWFGGKYPGTFIAVLCVMTTAITDFMAGMLYPYNFVESWNLLMHLGFFVMFSLLLSILKFEFAERARLIKELQEALGEVKQLSGLLPICASCKKIRDDQGYWNQIEFYISKHSEAKFTHGVCPECTKKLYPEYYEIVFGKEGEKENE
jgi:K+-sensing histidine kinase KdpD